MSEKIIEIEENISTEEKISKDELFVKVTKDIIEISAGYQDVNPELYVKFMGAFKTFLKLSKLSEGKETDNLQIQLDIFQEMFNLDLTTYAIDLMDNYMENLNNDCSIDDDINKADNELLSNIKANIDKYLKD